jgi:hypothetical protein
MVIRQVRPYHVYKFLQLIATSDFTNTNNLSFTPIINLEADKIVP